MARLYHLGCGDRRLDGYVNVDIRPSAATDLVVDLNQLELPGDEAAAGFFSHAFFEHLRRDARVAHLSAVRRSLTSSGFACYLGLPDFERGPGIVGPRFDLFTSTGTRTETLTAFRRPTLRSCTNPSSTSRSWSSY